MKLTGLSCTFDERCVYRYVIHRIRAPPIHVVRRPADAWTSARHGATTVVHLAALIVATLFLSSAIGTLLPSERLSELLGESAGLREVIVAGFVAGLISGGPYATYPVIERIQESGAETPAVLTMLLGYGLISVGFPTDSCSHAENRRPSTPDRRWCHYLRRRGALHGGGVVRKRSAGD